MKNYEKPDFIKFDTIKIRTKKEYFKKTIMIFNQNFNPRNGKLTGMYYSSKNDNNIPFDLYIAVSEKNNSMTIEFSSKILRDKYPELITKDTFKQCLDNLNKLGICEIDAKAVSKDCYFQEVDVTSDTQMTLTEEILNTLNTLVANYRRWRWERYENSGITFTKDVKSKDCKESLKIYNKEKEIALPKNEKFLSQLDNPESVKQAFAGITRFETTLSSMDKIKKYLDIPDTHVDNVFNSKANPVLLQFNKIFGTEECNVNLTRKSYDEYTMTEILKLYDNNLKQIEMNLRYNKCYSTNSRTGLSDRMKKYKELKERLLNETPYNSTVLSDIRKKLQAQ